MKTTIFAVWKFLNGEIDSEVLEIEGKVNHYSVEKAIKNSLSYYKRHDPFIILSWQIEDEYTSEEFDEFWENYNK